MSYFHLAISFLSVDDLYQGHKVDQNLVPFLRTCQLELDIGSASQVAMVVKNRPANAGDIRDAGLGRASGGGSGNPLQYSCLENPTDRGAW